MVGVSTVSQQKTQFSQLFKRNINIFNQDIKSWRPGHAVNSSKKKTAVIMKGNACIHSHTCKQTIERYMSMNLSL